MRCDTTWKLQNITGINLIPRNTKRHGHLRYSFFKIVSLCKYTLLPGKIKALETFLEVILRKSFQLFRRILNVRSITKAPPFQCWFQLREHAKISWNQVRRVWGDAPMLTNCFLLRNPWRIPTGVLEHFREGETNCLFFIFGAFSSDRIPKATKDIGVHFFIHSFPNAAFIVNFNSKIM